MHSVPAVRGCVGVSCGACALLSLPSYRKLWRVLPTQLCARWGVSRSSLGHGPVLLPLCFLLSSGDRRYEVLESPVSCETVRRTFALLHRTSSRFSSVTLSKSVPQSLEGLRCLCDQDSASWVLLEFSIPVGWFSLAVSPDDFHSPGLASVMEKS